MSTENLNLTIRQPAGEPRVVPLDRSLTIGRGQSCDIALDDPLVSQRHVTLAPEGEGMLVRDQGSASGTFVDGAHLAVPLVVGPGATVTIGGTEIEVTRPEPAPPPEPAQPLIQMPPDQMTRPIDMSSDMAAAQAEPVEAPAPETTAAETTAAGTTASGAGGSQPDRDLADASLPATASQPRWRVSVIKGPDTGRQVAVEPGESIGIGRHPGSGLVLADETVSGRHAQLDLRAGEVFLTDLGSSNGTLVAGVPLTPNTSLRLTEAVEVVMGLTLLVIHPDTDAGADP